MLDENSKWILGKADQVKCRDVTTLRMKEWAENKSKSSVYGTANDMSDFKATLQWTGAETAFARYFGIEPDWTWKVAERNMVYDCILNSWTIDVKNTRYESGHLLVKFTGRDWSWGMPDYFALVVGKFPSYRIAGFSPWMEICQDENPREPDGHFIHNKCYAMPQYLLSRWVPFDGYTPGRVR